MNYQLPKYGTNHARCSCGRVFKSMDSLAEHRSFSQKCKRETKEKQQAYEAVLHYSGACRPQPGHGAVAYVLHDYRDNKTIVFNEALPWYPIDNVKAEYIGLCDGLACAIERGIRSIKVFGDSETVFKHMNGYFPYDHCQGGLKSLHDRATAYMKLFDNVHFRKCEREENEHARSLGKEAIPIPGVCSGSSSSQEPYSSDGNGTDEDNNMSSASITISPYDGDNKSIDITSEIGPNTTEVITSSRQGYDEIDFPSLGRDLEDLLS